MSYPITTEVTTLESTVVQSTNTLASDYNFYSNIKPFPTSRVRGWMKACKDIFFYVKDEVSKIINSAHRVEIVGAATSIPASTDTDIIWTEVTDIGSNFATNQFTAPITGNYTVTGYIGTFCAASATRQVSITKDIGGGYVFLCSPIQLPATVGDLNSCFSLELRLNAGNKIKFFARTSSVGNIRTGESSTKLSIRLNSF